MKLLKELNNVLNEKAFAYEFDKVSKKQAENLARNMGFTWKKIGNQWTYHENGNHIFTYVVNRNVLFSDKSWNDGAGRR